MKIFAWSDGHGEFPHNWEKEEHVDVVIIAGDIVPLHIQRDPESSLNWFENEFFDYVRSVNNGDTLYNYSTYRLEWLPEWKYERKHE